MKGVPEILSEKFGIYYALVNPDLALDVSDSALFRYLGLESLPGTLFLADLFYELIGFDDDVAAVISGSRQEFCIPTINRVTDREIYFDLYLYHYPPAGRAALLVVKDATSEGLSLRAVQQRRNELVLKNQELISNEYFIRTLLDMIPNPIYYKDRGGAYIGCNDAFAKFISLTREEIIGKTVHEVVERSNSLFFSDKDNDLLKTGGVQQFEAPITGLDGKKSHVIFSKAMFPGEDGGPGGIVGVLIDITERKRMEERLSQLGTAVEKSPASIVITDPSGRIEYVNQKFCDLTGFTVGEALGENPRILKSGHHSREFYEGLWSTIGAGHEWRGEILNRKKNGALYWEMVSISPIFDDGGNIIHFVAVKEDITDLKRAMEELVKTGNELRRSNETMQEDLQIARRVVDALIQKEMPVIDACAIECIYRPFNIIGGDYYALRALDGGLSAFVCDISGHGVGSALFLSLIRYLSGLLVAECGYEPGRYLAELNGHLAAVMSTYFLTAIYAHVSFDETPLLRFSNGGHPHPIVCRCNGDISYAGDNGPLVGISPYMNYQTFSVELAPGDRVFFYTDGLPETRNREGREIGLDDGLLNMFERARRGSLKEMMEAIFEEMDRYRGDRPVEDDLLLIGIEIMKQARGR